MTDGTAGTLSTGGNGIEHHRAYPVDAIDTTGAGDVFHGVFTVFLIETGDESVAIDLASAAAALSCTRAGGRDGAPDRNTLDRFIEEIND